MIYANIFCLPSYDFSVRTLNNHATCYALCVIRNQLKTYRQIVTFNVSLYAKILNIFTSGIIVVQHKLWNYFKIVIMLLLMLLLDVATTITTTTCSVAHISSCTLLFSYSYNLTNTTIYCHVAYHLRIILKCFICQFVGWLDLLAGYVAMWLRGYVPTSCNVWFQ